MYTLLLLLLLLGLLALSLQNKEPFLIPSDHAMVIVEPRAHKDLQRVVENFDSLMPGHYEMYVFHGKSSRNFAAEATSRVNRRCHLIALDTDNLTAAQYNALFTTAAFWRQIPAEHVFVFQTDTALCSGTPHDISRFEKFDYVGCPYAQESVGQNGYWASNAFYGVGGLSFRKRSAMLRCIEKGGQDPGTPEDVFFSNCQHSTSPKPTPEDLSALCSQHSHRGHSFGAHQIRNLSASDKTSFTAYCPESSFLV